MFAVKMQKYLGKPFRVGATGPDAYDCVGFVYRYVKDTGKKIANSFEGFTPNNYTQIIQNDQKLEDDKINEWAKTLGKELKPSQALAGDVVIVQSGSRRWPCVYCGNGHAISVSRSLGVRVIKIDHKHVNIILAVRVKDNV